MLSHDPMKFKALTLSLLLASCCLPVLAGSPDFWLVSDQRRSELRGAVEAHRAATRDEVRREEAAAGRRLTPAELAELRQQVRQQWLPRHDALQSSAATRHEAVPSGEPQPAERMMPSPAVKDAALAAPRSQRP
ncbi:hypothetical protein [Variovorax sp. J22R115]|uniref:hypothetical protein n=1 Tax=Variovorax sp. J22R115 TaxID=3053509 RepID=UPI002576763C|nr:hypothetical protein [Variovorax sp. J22R115]MDM0048512.1 hypothetical protein [Variovorax sp. J22R115]